MGQHPWGPAHSTTLALARGTLHSFYGQESQLDTMQEYCSPSARYEQVTSIISSNGRGSKRNLSLNWKILGKRDFHEELSTACLNRRVHLLLPPANRSPDASRLPYGKLLPVPAQRPAQPRPDRPRRMWGGRRGGADRPGRAVPSRAGRSAAAG